MELEEAMLDWLREQGPQGLPFYLGEPQTYHTFERTLARELGKAGVQTDEASVWAALNALNRNKKVLVFDKCGVHAIVCLPEQAPEIRQALRDNAADPIAQAAFLRLAQAAWTAIWEARQGKYFEGGIEPFLIERLGINRSLAKRLYHHLHGLGVFEHAGWATWLVTPPPGRQQQ